LPKIREFIEELKTYSSSSVSLNIYNPWKDFDGVYDIGKEAPEIRCDQLDNYLRLRVPHAKYIFVAEALGFQGGHFSGIAMTSERILLNHHKNNKLNCSLVLNRTAKRTSKKACPGLKKIQIECGYNEPTATIIWESIVNSKWKSTDIILWNIFPFHPYKEDILTNRTPNDSELKVGIKYLELLRNLVKEAKIITIGAKSHQTFNNFNIKHSSVPHPANGGANDYRNQIAHLLDDNY